MQSEKIIPENCDPNFIKRILKKKWSVGVITSSKILFFPHYDFILAENISSKLLMQDHKLQKCPVIFMSVSILTTITTSDKKKFDALSHDNEVCSSNHLSYPVVHLDRLLWICLSCWILSYVRFDKHTPLHFGIKFNHIKNVARRFSHQH